MNRKKKIICGDDTRRGMGTVVAERIATLKLILALQ